VFAGALVLRSALRAFENASFESVVLSALVEVGPHGRMGSCLWRLSLVLEAPMNLLLCPSKWEASKSFFRKTKIMGMGPEAARNYANRLNLLNPQGWIVVYGSAGALDPKMKVGQSFLINSVGTGDASFDLQIPKKLQYLPQASCLSRPAPVSLRDEKKSLYLKSGFQLVDCEMGYFLDELREDLRSRCVFVRSVLDRADTNLHFLDGFNLKWRALLNPVRLLQFLFFVRAFFVYKREIDEFLKRFGESLPARPLSTDDAVPTPTESY